MQLPQSIRTLTPDRWRHDPRLRALALGAGLIPPRPMHSAGEAAQLADLAGQARVVVELGVYEGSSAVVLVRALPPGGVLHLVDPFLPAGSALPAGWQAYPVATRRAVERHRPAGVSVEWHLARSQDAGRSWTGDQVDLVFIDGDHSPQACLEDWEVWHSHVRRGGRVAFHDARLGQADGTGHPGPTEVVNRLFRDSRPPGWRIEREVDSLVVVRCAS